jgi:hypothetical protein
MKERGCQYGFFPLTTTGNLCEFLVFGGIHNRTSNIMRQTAILQININDVAATTLRYLKSI